MANRDINRLKVILANKKYTGKIRQKSGLYKIEHLQDIQKGKFVEVKYICIGLYIRNCIH